MTRIEDIFESWKRAHCLYDSPDKVAHKMVPEAGLWAVMAEVNDLTKEVAALLAIETKLHDDIDHLTAQLAAKDQERNDLAMLVRRLCFAMSKTGTHAKLQEQALDCLIRKGLQGSILREEQTDDTN